MVLRLFFLNLSIFFFVSCDFISQQDTSLQRQVKLDTVIDYTTVDVYPLFAECKDLNVQEAQIQCFEKNLIDKLNSLINLKKANTAYTFQDTMFVDLSVAQDYRIKIANIQTTPNIARYLPEIDSVLSASVNQLPSVVQPAIKRGIPVHTQFKLPVLITVK